MTDTRTTNKISCLKELESLGIAVVEGHIQRADGTLPHSLDGSIKTLSERLAEGMSNEFFRLKGTENKDIAEEYFAVHDRFAKYIPGYEEEFEKINAVR